MASSLSTTPPFDPRALPVWQEATRQLQQQPAIAATRLQADALQQRFGSTHNWQPEARHDALPPAPVSRDAAVLIGLQAAPRSNALQVVLTQRCQHLDAHPGQIAFPGGKIDAGDADATAAALREAREEVSLQPEQTQVLGTLPPFETGT